MDGLAPNPTPQAPEPQAPAPTPVAPEPAAPVAPVEAPAPNDDAAAQAEQAEWDAAHNEVFPGLESNNPEFNKDEPVTTTTTTETTQAPETTTTTTTVAPAPGPDGDNPSGEPAADAAGTGDEDGKTSSGTETPTVNPVLTPQEYAKQQSDMRADIRNKLFANTPTELKAGDGTKLDTIESVMQFVNPATVSAEEPEGRTFNQEEAAAFLLNQTQKLNNDVSKMNNDIERIADLNLEITTEANKITAKYGEMLNKNPELKAKLWENFSKTAKWQTGKDADGKDIDVIVDAPLSLEQFYEDQLGPRMEAERIKTESEAALLKQQQDAQQLAEQQRKQNRADRSDIYTPGTPDVRDDDDKEWEDAHKAVFGEDFQKRI